MNFLAHAYLSGPAVEWQLGNFLGDFVKGRVEKYHAPGVTEDLRNGLRLHRAIDSFTDQHPLVQHSKTVFRPRYGLRSGIIVDVLYDHFLARDWKNHASVPLIPFTQWYYALLRENNQRLPPEARSAAEAMATYDWLTGYAQIPGIERALTGLSRRVPVAAGIQTAGDEIRTHYEALGQDFDQFFPLLADFCRRFIQESPRL